MSDMNYDAVRRVLDDYSSLKDWPEEPGQPTHEEIFIADLERLSDDIPELDELLDKFDEEPTYGVDSLFDDVAELVDYTPGEAL